MYYPAAPRILRLVVFRVLKKLCRNIIHESLYCVAVAFAFGWAGFSVESATAATSTKSTKKRATGSKKKATGAKAASPKASVAPAAKPYTAVVAKVSPKPVAVAAKPSVKASAKVAALSPEAAILLANKRARIARGTGWVQTWDEPTYKNSTSGDNTVGEDPVVREAAVEALGSLNGSIVVVDPETGRILTIVNRGNWRWAAVFSRVPR